MLISERARGMSSKEKIKDSERIGREGELAFDLLIGAEKGSAKEDISHIDYKTLSGLNIDVKGNKNSHKYGYVLIEINNVNGNHGWCHPDSKADIIAFEFDNGFFFFKKNDLYNLAINLAGEPDFVDRNAKIRHKDGSWRYIYNDVKNKWLGRWERKDVFTFIHKSELLELEHIFKPKKR